MRRKSTLNKHALVRWVCHSYQGNERKQQFFCLSFCTNKNYNTYVRQQINYVCLSRILLVFLKIIHIWAFQNSEALINNFRLLMRNGISPVLILNISQPFKFTNRLRYILGKCYVYIKEYILSYVSNSSLLTTVARQCCIMHMWISSAYRYCNYEHSM